MLSKEEAIERLLNYKKEKVLVYKINFDEMEERKKFVSKEECFILIENAKTIIFNEDDFISHMELFSVLQRDIENLTREGIMYDVLLLWDMKS